MSCFDGDERWISEADEQGNCTAYVTVASPVSSNVQITAAKRSFPDTFKFLIDNIAHIFTNKVNKTVADNTTNATRFLTFTSTQTDTDLLTDDGLTYNPSTGVLTAESFTGNLTGNVTGNLTGDVTGNLSGAAAKATADSSGNVITSTYATKTEISNNDITAVSLSGNTITLTKGDATTITATVGNLSVNTTGSAAKLTTARTLTISGKATGSASFDGSADATINVEAVTLEAADIPNLPASRINSGTLSADRLPLSFTTDTTNKKYKVEKDTTSGQLFVAVPWTGTGYTHPAYTAKSSVFGYVTSDATGHITGITAITAVQLTTLAGGTTGTTLARGDHTHNYSATFAALSHGHTKSQISDFPTIPTAGLGLTSGFAVNATTVTSDFGFTKLPLHINSSGELYVLVKPSVNTGYVRNSAGDGSTTAVTNVTLTAG